MIHHIALFSRRPIETAAFYSAVLGLAEIQRKQDDLGHLDLAESGHNHIVIIERADGAGCGAEKPAEGSAPGESLPDRVSPGRKGRIGFC